MLGPPQSDMLRGCCHMYVVAVLVCQPPLFSSLQVVYVHGGIEPPSQLIGPFEPLGHGGDEQVSC